MTDVESKEIQLASHVSYLIVISEPTLHQITDYKCKLFRNVVEPGAYLKEQIDMFVSGSGTNLGDISTEKFISLLLATKKPKCYAARDIICDGSDWTNLEVKMLGDINITMPVVVYDNGVWSVKDSKFQEHNPYFEGELLYTPGPLFQKSDKFIGETPEFLEVVFNNNIDQNKYNKLIERRLSPLLTYVNETAKLKDCSAIVIVPGLGCGVFAGKFKGTLGQRLNEALKYIIKKNAKNYSSIKCIYYDPYDECQVESEDFEGVKYRVRPYNVCGKPQLCAPEDYEERDDDFSNCKLFKVVAWDHLSYPGNGYFYGSRFTDDGMAGAATNTMEVLTNFEGRYRKGYYRPPKGNSNWYQVVRKSQIQLVVDGNVRVVTDNGLYFTLNEFEQSNLNRPDQILGKLVNA